MSKSIMEPKGSRVCFLCALLDGDDMEKRALHKHHIFPGKNRKLSEHYGLWVHLCVKHHEGDIEGCREAVHHPEFNGYQRMLQEMAQEKWESLPGHTHEEWMEIFGENFIGRNSHNLREKSTEKMEVCT